MSSPNRPSQESSSSPPFSTYGQEPELAIFFSSTGLAVARGEMSSPALSLLFSSSSSNGGRYFCPTCNCTTILGPFTAWVSCPICREPFQLEQEAQPAAAFPSQSTSNATVRAAGFVNWHLCNNLFFVAWEHDFFFHFLRKTSEAVSVPSYFAGTFISLPLLQNFLLDCFKYGASITISSDEEAATYSLMTVKEALLANLELRDGLHYSSEMICSVCLDSLSNGKKVMETPCSHSFHESCLLPWVIKEKTCPICRSNIITEAFGTEVKLLTDNAEDLRQLMASDFLLRPNQIIRKFKIELLWPHEGTSSHAEASCSEGGHDTNQTG